MLSADLADNTCMNIYSFLEKKYDNMLSDNHMLHGNMLSYFLFLKTWVGNIFPLGSYPLKWTV
jgi:hypothetical protein